MAEVRRIRSGERAAALETIVAAFRRDPQLRWWFPGEDEYDESARAFFGVLLDTRIEGGEVWVGDDCRAVAMWLPPGGNLIGPELASARYTVMTAALAASASERIQRTDEAVDGLLPSGAHWYLGVLACHPDRHGSGLGWAVAVPVLAAADRAGLPVALETSSPVNVGYYTRRGFAVIGEVTLLDGEVTLLDGEASRWDAVPARSRSRSRSSMAVRRAGQAAGSVGPTAGSPFG